MVVDETKVKAGLAVTISTVRVTGRVDKDSATAN